MASAVLMAAASVAYQWEREGQQHVGQMSKVLNPTVCDPNVKQYAGTYDIDGGKKSYFYWAFEARNKSANTPTLLWMTGGPGCSSELAMLYENGPCHANADGTGTVNNPYSWNSFANLVYIDQPAGVGFSTGKMDDHNEKGVADDMYAFLQEFFADHPEWNRNFYIFGESYGGHYAPATAHRVWQGGKSGEGTKINLAGLAVGNGLTDPEIQYKWYPEMGYNWSIEVKGKPVFPKAEYDAMKLALPACIEAIKGCNADVPLSCRTAQEVCNAATLIPYKLTGLNPYDIREKCEKQPLCYDFSNIHKYLNSKELQEAIGVNKKWESCNYLVNFEFGGDWMKNYQTMLPELLQDGVRVLIYAGDVDYICNWLGNKAWTLALDWQGKSGFNAAGDHQWVVNNATAGNFRTYKGFTFLQVHNAGHMVPADQPANALQMVNTFVHDGRW